MLKLAWKLREDRNRHSDFIVGNTLTILEGVITDDRQLKALKDVIRNSIWAYKGDATDEILIQFKEKYCPTIEDDNQYKLTRNFDDYPKEVDEKMF